MWIQTIKLLPLTIANQVRHEYMRPPHTDQNYDHEC